MHTQTYGHIHTDVLVLVHTHESWHTHRLTHMDTDADPRTAIIARCLWQARPPPPAVFLCTPMAAARHAQALLVLLSQLGGVSTGRPSLDSCHGHRPSPRVAGSEAHRGPAGFRSSGRRGPGPRRGASPGPGPREGGSVPTPAPCEEAVGGTQNREVGEPSQEGPPWSRKLQGPCLQTLAWKWWAQRRVGRERSGG